MAKIKICGMMRPQDIAYVNEAQPDYIGFILTDGFRRSISKKTAQQLKALLDPKIKAVGVFVDDEIQKIQSFIDENIIDMVQLHGQESPAYCAKITGAPIIKAIICTEDMADAMSDYPVDYFLFDSGRGSGRQLDISLLPQSEKPFFLAGGVTTDTIPEMEKALQPFGFDLSSAVETDGYKDKEKILEIVRRVRHE